MSIINAQSKRPNNWIGGKWKFVNSVNENIWERLKKEHQENRKKREELNDSYEERRNKFIHDYGSEDLNIRSDAINQSDERFVRGREE